MKILVLAAVGLLAAAGAGTGLFFGYVEAASVRISVSPRYVEADAVVHGATTGSQFKTERLQVSLTETARGSATGVTSSPATYAHGYVVFHYSCVSITQCTPTPVQAGREVCKVNTSGPGAVCYTLQSTVTCFCGESVAVRADHPGPNWNIDAHTVNYIEANSTGETVDNPAPISGGAFATSSPVVQQSDLDSAVSSITSKLGADLRSAVRVRTRAMHYLVDAVPTISVFSDVAAGAHTGSFSVTGSGTLGATTFVDAQVEALIARSLTDRVPSGYHLSGTPDVTDYRVQDWNAQGNVSVSGKAIGYLVPIISVNSLRQRLRGLDPKTASAVIESVAPGSRVDIRLIPGLAPLLPINGDRIAFEVVTSPTPSD